MLGHILLFSVDLRGIMLLKQGQSFEHILPAFVQIGV